MGFERAIVLKEDACEKFSNIIGDLAPKSKITATLENAIREAEKKNNKSLLEHFVQRAYEDNTVLIALMRKILPDVKFVAAESHSKEDISVRVSIADCEPNFSDDQKNPLIIWIDIQLLFITGNHLKI